VETRESDIHSPIFECADLRSMEARLVRELILSENMVEQLVRTMTRVSVEREHAGAWRQEVERLKRAGAPTGMAEWNPWRFLLE
jgi:hypothetical protein